SGPAPHAEPGTRAIGVAVGLAKVLVQAAGKGPSEYRVEDLERVKIRRTPVHTGMADADLGLRGAWLVDQEDAGRLGGRCLRGDGIRHGSGGPVTEHLFHQRVRGSVHIADHDEGGSAWAIEAAMEVDQRLPVDALYRFLAGEPPVRM